MEKQGRVRALRIAGMILSALACAGVVMAQAQKERTLDEIKTEAIKRAENGMYPLIGLDPADVREAFASIKTSDKDEWAAAFMAVAHRYIAGTTSVGERAPAQAKSAFNPASPHSSFGRLALAG